MNSESKRKENIGIQARGSRVKNVTKNIGKLLMKFIWKNKGTLKQQMSPDEEAWEIFLTLLRTWKKENNVTRDFLVSKWQGKGEEFRIFRVVAHHFFRKHCLPAILRSNIRLKRIHFERISKFNQAIVDPGALDYLA